jgi:hypothetical protein
MTLKAYTEDELVNLLTIGYTVTQCRKLQCETLLFGLGQIKVRKYLKWFISDVVHILHPGGLCCLYITHCHGTRVNIVLLTPVR